MLNSNSKIKKVAIIGCSHSDIHSNDHENWTTFLARRYSNINFHNYASSGHGHVFHDLVLKHVMYEEEYDKIIVQLTGDNRWSIPLPHDINLDDKWIIEQHGSCGNMYKHRLKFARYNTTSFNSTCDQDLLQKLKTLKEYNRGSLSVNGFNLPEAKEWQYTPGVHTMAQYYSKLFVKSLDRLPVVYFSFHNDMGNNIGLPGTITSIFGERWGELGLVERLDDTLHCTNKGYRDMTDILLESKKFREIFNA